MANFDFDISRADITTKIIASHQDVNDTVLDEVILDVLADVRRFLRSIGVDPSYYATATSDAAADDITTIRLATHVGIVAHYCYRITGSWPKDDIAEYKGRRGSWGSNPSMFEAHSTTDGGADQVMCHATREYRDESDQVMDDIPDPFDDSEWTQ